MYCGIPYPLIQNTVLQTLALMQWKKVVKIQLSHSYPQSRNKLQIERTDYLIRGKELLTREKGAVITCVYDLDLSRLGIEPRSPAHEVNAVPIRHRGGQVSVIAIDLRFGSVSLWFSILFYLLRTTFMLDVLCVTNVMDFFYWYKRNKGVSTVKCL